MPAAVAGPSSAVNVLHAVVPGRLRLAVAGLKGDPEQARGLGDTASGWPGVWRASASPVTGTFLLEYDPAAVNMEHLVARARTAALGRAANDEGVSGAVSRPAPRGGRRPSGRQRSTEILHPREAPPVPPAPPRRQRRLEAALGAAAVAGTGVILLALRAHGHALVIDQAPLSLAEQVHSDALTAVMRAASRLVDPPVLIPVTAVATALGVGRHRRSDLPWLAPTAVFGGGAVIHTLKVMLRRSRPTAFAHLTRVSGYSLPSGHAFMAMCLYGLLAHHGLRWLRARRPDDRHSAAVLMAAAATAVLMVGISRVYLGVHYLTDVIAGFVLALLWLWLLAAINDLTPLGSGAVEG